MRRRKIVKVVVVRKFTMELDSISVDSDSFVQLCPAISLLYSHSPRRGAKKKRRKGIAGV